ncbi:MAG TPA: type IV toxin-antitoxin system AbiEi family antitoxin [Candidatus Dormibacteraeota bacterium]|nr:type IV toxin-antitoxin system AbiEi family antitoxin [Candidatus Dormibacteraeota bacterium]
MLAAQRVRELMPKVMGWEQSVDVKVGGQTADVVVKFKMGEKPHTLTIGVTSLGQPRQIRETVTRLTEIRRDMPEAYPVAVSPYISPQSAALLKRSGVGYLDLSGNCYLSFESVHIEKEGKPNLRPSTRPLKSLFAPRATRVVRVLLVDPQHAWRLEELAKAAEVSLGHAHNVVKRLEELSWVERNGQQRIQLTRAGDLLDAWVDAYAYTQNDLQAYFSHERITRGLVAELGRVAHEARRRYAFTLHSGAALVAPNVRFPAIHCYLEGDPEPVARALGLRPGEGEGNIYLLAPYDHGVFYSPMAKGGLPVVCLPQLYADLYHYERRGREQAAHLRREAMGY